MTLGDRPKGSEQQFCCLVAFHQVYQLESGRMVDNSRWENGRINTPFRHIIKDLRELRAKTPINSLSISLGEIDRWRH